MPTDCLTSLLGLAPAPTDCLPFPEGDTAFITESVTGLYLSKVPGLSLRSSDGSLWYERLGDARDEAVRKVRAALSQSMRTGFAPRHTWIGAVSDTQYTGTGTDGQLCQLVFKTHRLDSAALKLNTLHLLTNVDSAEELPVLLDGKPVGTVSPGGSAQLSTALVPCDGLDHVLSVQLPAGVRPRLNKILCGGCSQQGKVLSGYLRNAKDVANGLAVSAQAVCTAPEQLCYVASTPEGSDTPVDYDLRLQLGYALQYGAGSELIVQELADGTAGRLTGLNTEALGELADRYEGKYKEYIAYLSGSKGISSVPSPCWVCTSSGPFIGKSY